MAAGRVLVFSPPKKPGEPKVEVAVLQLQPFADAPQISFEEVPRGREAVRQLRVVNPAASEHVVTLRGALGQKGFAADRETFTVPPRGEQTVSFSWRPDGKDQASRAVLTVTSDKGFRGRCVLLGTVKPQPAKPVLKSPAPKKLPAPKILTASQRLNVVRTAAPTKPCSKGCATPVKLTVPKEFTMHSKKRPPPANGTSSSKNGAGAKVSRPTGPSTATTKETGPQESAGPESQQTKRNTFDRDTVAVTAAVLAERNQEELPECLGDRTVDGD